MGWQLLAVAAGGALGALARFGVGAMLPRLVGTHALPWPTIAVNLIGCFLFGLIWRYSEIPSSLHTARPFLLAGFMGSLTTFSTFAFENARFLEDGRLLLAGGNILLQNAAGLACLCLGMALARSL